jgi:hypothetical protein
MRLAVPGPTVVVVRSFTQLLADTSCEPLTKRRVSDSWAPPLSSVVSWRPSFVRHVIRGAAVEGVAQAVEHRVRSEVATTQLPFGALCLLSIRLRGMF